MNWFSFHVASGASFFSGSGLLLVGMFLTAKSKGRIKFLSKLAACLGMTLMALSSTPFPSWMNLLLLILFLGWIVVESISGFRSRTVIYSLRAFLVICTLIMGFIEIPNQLLPKMPERKCATIYIVGDSISAGIDENPNWVAVFQKRYAANVENLAKPAATLSSALKQLPLVSSNDCLVLLEIGGNDLLGKANRGEFEKDLRELLISVEKPGRTLLMFELPLLPGQAGLGRVQRSLAKEHGVYLIPKRYFCKVLGAPNATVDGLHLSPVGTSLMAEMVHTIIAGLLMKQDPQIK
jgi:lysophospholipase L1-like esterase